MEIFPWCLWPPIRPLRQVGHGLDVLCVLGTLEFDLVILPQLVLLCG